MIRVSGLLRDRIVSGIRNDVLHKELLAEKRLMLEITIDRCRSAEVAEWGMESLMKNKTVDWVKF